jgi:uncharacterized protein YkwD
MRRFVFVSSFIITVFLWLVSAYLFITYKSVKNVASSTQIANLPTTSPIFTPTTIPSPIPKKVLGIVKTPLLAKKTVIVPQDDKKIYIMNAINNYRQSKGLSTISTNNLTCSFATVRAQEIANNFSHGGFQTRLSNHSLPYPNYSLVTENIAETSDYTKVVELWANSAGHAENMRANTPYVCVENYGNYYAYEGWSPL